MKTRERTRQLILSLAKPVRTARKNYSQIYDPYIMDHYHTSDGRVFTGEFLQDLGARSLVGDEYDMLMAEYKRRRTTR